MLKNKFNHNEMDNLSLHDIALKLPRIEDINKIFRQSKINAIINIPQSFNVGSHIENKIPDLAHCPLPEIAIDHPLWERIYDLTHEKDKRKNRVKMAIQDKYYLIKSTWDSFSPLVKGNLQALAGFLIALFMVYGEHKKFLQSLLFCIVWFLITGISNILADNIGKYNFRLQKFSLKTVKWHKFGHALALTGLSLIAIIAPCKFIVNYFGIANNELLARGIILLADSLWRATHRKIRGFNKEVIMFDPLKTFIGTLLGYMFHPLILHIPMIGLLWGPTLFYTLEAKFFGEIFWVLPVEARYIRKIKEEIRLDELQLLLNDEIAKGVIDLDEKTINYIKDIKGINYSSRTKMLTISKKLSTRTKNKLVQNEQLDNEDRQFIDNLYKSAKATKIDIAAIRCLHLIDLCMRKSRGAEILKKSLNGDIELGEDSHNILLESLSVLYHPEKLDKVLKKYFNGDHNSELHQKACHYFDPLRHTMKDWLRKNNFEQLVNPQSQLSISKHSIKNQAYTHCRVLIDAIKVSLQARLNKLYKQKVVKFLKNSIEEKTEPTSQDVVTKEGENHFFLPLGEGWCEGDSQTKSFSLSLRLVTVVGLTILIFLIGIFRYFQINKREGISQERQIASFEKIENVFPNWIPHEGKDIYEQSVSASSVDCVLGKTLPKSKNSLHE